MAVTIPSDLIADVMRSADPARLSAASQKLGGTSDQGSMNAAGFSGTLDGLGGAVKSKADATTGNTTEAGAYKAFEQMMLRNVLELILPQADSGIYGGDMSSGIWRSMAADQLATVYSDAGGAGIAETLSPAPHHSAQYRVVLQDQWPYFVAPDIRGFAG